MSKMYRIPLSIMQMSHNGVASEAPAKNSSQASFDDEVKTYKLPPEEVERLLKAEYGDKLEAVNLNNAGKQRLKSPHHSAFH